ncbi:hypothetical protein GCM10007382_13670 [Salinibacterium xinjiangense]|nr:hypothetical protein GCM10007382_13670 [Salinibacterium xinjiangense]
MSGAGGSEIAGVSVGTGFAIAASHLLLGGFGFAVAIAIAPAHNNKDPTRTAGSFLFR